MTKPHIVVVGSINMDLVVRVERLPRRGETLAARELATIPGGKGANQAVAAARLGARVTMVGRVGDDPFAPRLRAGLAAEGIDIAHVQDTAGCSSGVAIIGVEKEGDNAIMIVPGANGRLTPRDIQEREAIIASADSLLLQLEVPFETVQAAMVLAKKHGVRVILDPAPAPSAPVPFPVDVISPNQTETESLTGINPGDWFRAEEAARVLRDQGAEQVVLKLGERGAFYLAAGGGGAVATTAVNVVDTTAAGDAFTAAMAVGLAQGLSLPEATRLACAAGSLAVTRSGAQPAMPTREEADAFLARLSP